MTLGKVPEKRLRTSSDYQLFYEAFQASPIGIALEDLEGRPLHVNSALCSMLGFSEEEMRGKHCVEFSPDEDAQKDWALFQQLKAGTIDHYTLEKRFIRKDGGLTWGRLSISLLNHHASSLVVAMVEDVTPVRESEERFRLVANAAPVMIWMSGIDSLCTYFNEPWLAFRGRSLQAEIGSGWTTGVHPEDLQECIDTYLHAFTRRDPFTMEYRIRRYDGEYRWIFDSGVPRFGRDGTFEGYIGSAVDVTDRKRAEEAVVNLGRKLIEAQEEERRNLARELHDDIGQKLAMLSLELQEAAAVVPISELALHNQLESLVERTSDVIEDVRALSHQLHSSKLETVGLVAAIRGFCREFSEQRRVQVSFMHNEVPDDIAQPVALCLFRVLQEALSNAAKHSGARQAEARLVRDGEDLQLSIRDAGVGFDPSTAMYNEGIGLISMRERVNIAKGTITIKSKPQEGTEIIVRVPIVLTS